MSLRSLTGWRSFVVFALSAWACAKSNAPTGDDSFAPPASGGSGGSNAVGGTGGGVGVGTGGNGVTSNEPEAGGSSATGGGSSISAGGLGAAGRANGTGGGANAVGGGTSLGGTTGTGALGGTGGGGVSTPSGGATSSAGSGTVGQGGAAVGTSLTGDGDMIVFYDTSSATPMTNTITLSLYVRNQTADALDLSNVELRYWMTAEVTPATHSYYSASGMDLKMPTWVDGPPSYVSFTFSKGGSVAAKNMVLNDTECQGTVSAAMGMFDQSDDWSFMPKATMPQANPNVTAYVAGKLVWGCEPSGICAGGMLPNATGGTGGTGEPADAGLAGEPSSGGQTN